MERNRKNKRKPRPGKPTPRGPTGHDGVLPAVVAAVQERWILPHCLSCARPCCTLEDLVLEFSWRQLRLLWGIRRPRREFDERLAQGKGPAEVRTQDGLYFVHKRVCPAYVDGRCSVYGSDLKPSGCSDFPLYVDDDGSLLADLRCEALSLERVEAELRSRLPGDASVRRRKHPEFPFLVTFRVARQAGSHGRNRRP